MRLPDQIEVYQDGDGPQVLSAPDIDGSDARNVHSYDGTLAMHRDFLDCVRTGRMPITDIRDVVHTSRLVARLEGDGG